MEIKRSARKHSSGRKRGMADPDFEHAVEQAMMTIYQGDGAWLYLGPSRSGALLEVVKVVRNGSEFIIHAMPIRPKYERLLSGGRALR
jgi:hypothetical protein